jgi:hypothetical protein
MTVLPYLLIEALVVINNAAALNIRFINAWSGPKRQLEAVDGKLSKECEKCLRRPREPCRIARCTGLSLLPNS